jgi:5-methylcytosine-specific restriction enzyme subunit McrC
MTAYNVREWEYVRVAEGVGDDTISRSDADSLIATARALSIGGDDGESILINGHKRLRAQQVVGVLASPNVTLEILPKIDGLDANKTRHFLVHMLAHVFDLNIASGAMTDLGSQRHDLLEILIKLFCDDLFEAVHRGLPRRYVGHEDDLAAHRGRLDVKRQFTVLAASPQKLACRYDDLSADIPLNQIMKAAVSSLQQIARSSENQRRLAELAFVFADIRKVAVLSLPWDRVVIDRTNTAWATLLNFAKLLLGKRFQTTTSGGQRGFSLMFEMNTLFEEFVGRTLKRALSRTDFDVRLQGPQKYALTEYGVTSRFATRPDIVISRNGLPVLIVDTKWKRIKAELENPKLGVGQADVYQMMAYAQVYQCPRLLLLYPHHDEIEKEEGLLNSYNVNGTADTRLSVASVNLTSAVSIGEQLESLIWQQTGDLSLTTNTAA